MPTTILDQSFSAAADTPLGAGPNSTNVGFGLADYTGNLWRIYEGSLQLYGAGTQVSSVLYPASATNVTNGTVRCYPGSGGQGGVGRFNPANGGSGYSGVFGFNNIYFSKRVNGTETQLQGNIAVTATLPAGGYVEFSWQQVDATHTQLTVSLYDPATPGTPLESHSYTDTEPALQNVSGSLGPTAYGQGSGINRLVLQNATGTLTATTSVATAYRTVVKLQGQAATGGTAPLAYQWKRNGAALTGATSLAYRDTTVTPGTAYTYQLVVTDGAGASATYQALNLSTFSANLSQSAVIAALGDSITFGVGASTLNAFLTEVANLNGAGVRAGGVNCGVSGATTTNWLKGSQGAGFYEALIIAANDIGADCVSLMLGTNDSRASLRTSAAQYRANLQSICTNLLADIPTLQRIILNEPPAVDPGVYGDGSEFDATANTFLSAYRAQLDSLANGTTIRRGSAVTYAYFLAHPEQLGDGIHPNQAGHTALGGQWNQAFLGIYPAAIILSITLSKSKAFGF